jgi:DNA repair protein RecN (Recombination protein N)
MACAHELSPTGEAGSASRRTNVFPAGMAAIPGRGGPDVLTELRVRDLGVIADLTLVLGDGMTALTGETGAGKTLVVEAIELLTGGRVDPVLVRPGAAEAGVVARFVVGDQETVLSRVVPASGRSRAYVDGRMAPVSALSEASRALVDLHGQHAHQSLLAAAAQRAALDVFAGVDLADLTAARAGASDIERQLAALGGDARARAREIDLLRFQVEEIAEAKLDDPNEDETLQQEEELLADATASREAAGLAHEALVGDGGALDALGTALAALSGRPPLAEHASRLKALAVELGDAAAELRGAAETLNDDPDRLLDVRGRRQLLRDLGRKYGDTLADVMAFADEGRRRLAELESYEERAATLEEERAVAAAAIVAAEAAVGRQRRAAAPGLAAAVASHLGDLALPRARLDVVVGDDDPGDDVTFAFGANSGEAVLPLSKVASGGELARVMLALRLVLTGVGREGADGPGTLVFDEVDAGIGGEAAVAVGRSLSALARRHQVLVVTHLPQVAAFAEHQVAVTKEERDGRTVADVAVLDDAARVVELSRMLSGQPDSATARQHADELLATAARLRDGKQPPVVGGTRSAGRSAARGKVRARGE